MSANLPKLLRTLGQYEADLLILPSGNFPRILVKNQWKIIEDGESSDITGAIKELLGEKLSKISKTVWKFLTNIMRSVLFSACKKIRKAKFCLFKD